MRRDTTGHYWMALITLVLVSLPLMFVIGYRAGWERTQTKTLAETKTLTTVDAEAQEKELAAYRLSQINLWRVLGGLEPLDPENPNQAQHYLATVEVHTRVDTSPSTPFLGWSGGPKQGDFQGDLTLGLSAEGTLGSDPQKIPLTPSLIGWDGTRYPLPKKPHISADTEVAPTADPLVDP